MDLSLPLSFRPLTNKEWTAFVELFSEHGIQNGCWCMYWRIQREICQRNYGAGNKMMLQAIVESGKVPGILAFYHDRAVGWCSITPREEVPVLDRSRNLKRVDDQQVWSITCFFVSKPYRRQEMTAALIENGLIHAALNGATVVEAYPLRSEISKMLPSERYMGILSTFESLDFQPIARRSDRRTIVRRELYPNFTFQDPGDLVDGDLKLVLENEIPSDPTLGYLPVYRFKMVKNSPDGESEILFGYVDLRIGNNRRIRLYGGHFAYMVLPEHRGHHYATRSCQLLLPLARLHGLTEIWITCNPDNLASRRTCENMGAELIEIVELPEDNDMYLEGERSKCRYRLAI